MLPTSIAGYYDEQRF